MSEYWMVIEGGGTRSECSVLDTSRVEIAKTQGPAMHAQRLSLDELVQRISKLCDQNLKEAELNWTDIQGLGLALAGADRLQDQDHIQKALPFDRDHLAIVITSDVRATHIGAFENGPGILAIAGTGSIVLGRNDREWKRAGGYGYRMGDEGSGHLIGMAGLRAVGKHYDDQEFTSLSEKLAEELNINSRDQLIQWTYESDHSPSQIAPFVIDCAEQDDAVCRDIIDRQMNQLIDLVESLTEKLDLPEGPLTYHGGLFKSVYFLEKFKKKARSQLENIHIQSPLYKPSAGVTILLERSQTDNSL